MQIQEFDKTNLRYQARMESMNEFFALNKLPPELHTKTRKYIDALWQLNRGIDHHTVLGDLPKSVRQDIMMTLHSKLVAQVPLFKSASEGFMKAVVMVLKPQVALPGDRVVVEGEDAEFMVFRTCNANNRHICAWESC